MRMYMCGFAVFILSIVSLGAPQTLVLSQGIHGYTGVLDTWAADWIWDGNNGHGSAAALGVLQEFCPG